MTSCTGCLLGRKFFNTKNYECGFCRMKVIIDSGNPFLQEWPCICDITTPEKCNACLLGVSYFSQTQARVL